MAVTHILIIDQGATSTRGVIFHGEARRVGIAQAGFRRHYPEPGWVEHDPEGIRRDAPAIARGAMGRSGVPAEPVAAIGMAKSTCGTGCLMLPDTGGEAVATGNRLLATPACRLDGRMAYALEGSIFVAGVAVKWLRDGIGAITHAGQTDNLAMRVPDNYGVYLVPAFAGLGASSRDAGAGGMTYGRTIDARNRRLVGARPTRQAVVARAPLRAVDTGRRAGAAGRRSARCGSAGFGQGTMTRPLAIGGRKTHSNGSRFGTLAAIAVDRLAPLSTRTAADNPLRRNPSSSAQA